MDKNIICSRGNVCNLVKLSFAHCLQELIVWLINQNLTKTQIFLNGKLAFILRRRKSLGLCSNFKIFWGSMPPDTRWKRGLLIQSVNLFKSAGYFNSYCNHCKRKEISLSFQFRRWKTKNKDSSGLDGQLILHTANWIRLRKSKTKNSTIFLRKRSKDS